MPIFVQQCGKRVTLTYQYGEVSMEFSEPIIDYGTAPTKWVNGLARVDLYGPDTLFALWRHKTTSIDGRMLRTREVVLNVAMPTEAVPPGLELTIITLGPRMLLPTAGYALRRMVM
jgi:hypothetical protein